METIAVEILTPNGPIYAGDAKLITLPGEEGEFGVLPEHASLTTMLHAGVVEIETATSTESVVINWGVVQVSESNVIVLVDGAVAIRGENESQIATALDEAKELLQSVSDANLAIASVSTKLDKAAQNLL